MRTYEDLYIEIEPSDVITIHRILGKESHFKPVIAKIRNTEIKIKIMRIKKGLKNDIKFHDDITQINLGLLARLNTNEMLDNAWFYNCSVYGKLKDSKYRMKFDPYDNKDDKIKKKLSSMQTFKYVKIFYLISCGNFFVCLLVHK